MTEETLLMLSPAELRLRRLHAFSGALAAAAFLVEHIATQATALRGEAAWDRVGGWLERSQVVAFFELFFVIVPLVFHATVGAKIVRAGRAVPSEAERFGSPALLRAQWLTGVLVAVFLLGHFWELSAQRLFFGLTADQTYTVMTEDFSRTWGGIPLLALLTITGIGLVCFHFANGLSATSRLFRIGSPRVVRVVATALGAGLFVVGSASVVSLATGMALTAPPALPDGACGTAVKTP